VVGGLADAVAAQGRKTAGQAQSRRRRSYRFAGHRPKDAMEMVFGHRRLPRQFAQVRRFPRRDAGLQSLQRTFDTPDVTSRLSFAHVAPPVSTAV
jgi:hypothetical protein